MKLEIDFTTFQNRLRLTQSADGRTTVFDPIRKKEIVVTPEEILRQLVLHFLLEEIGCPPGRIGVEKGINFNGMKKRADIIVFDPTGLPWLLVECKSPKVAITQDTFDQTARYNLTLRVPFLAVTNGLVTCCCSMDYEVGSWKFLSAWPTI